MRTNTWMRKPIAFILTIAVFIGAIAVPGVGSQEVYAATPQETARQSLLSAVAYYSEYEDWELNNWEEQLAIYGSSKVSESGVILKEWVLPSSPKVTSDPNSYLPVIIDATIKGQVSVASAAVTSLSSIATSDGAIFSTYPDVQAQCMLAMEIASTAGISLPETYKGIMAAEYLITMQEETGGFSGQYDGTLKTVDTAGYVALALAPYVTKEGFADAVGSLIGFLDEKQLTTGGFPYEYEGGSFGDYSWPGGSYESANSTALAVWGLSALQAGIEAETAPDPTIGAILIAALPALTKWQNSDGSFTNGGSSEFDSFTTRQVMIALYAIATGQNLFQEIQLSSSELVPVHVRIESDAHLPVDTDVSAAKGDSLAEVALVAWGKQSRDSFGEVAYEYFLNESSAFLSTTIQGYENRLLLVDKNVITRAAFIETSISGSLNIEKSVTLLNANTREPLEGVVITIDGDYVGYDPSTWQPLVTDNSGTLVIPADKLLEARTYQISTSTTGVSKDICEISIGKGEPETKMVSVRIEGIDRNIANERLIFLTSTGDKSITAYDAINAALNKNKIEATIYDSGYIFSIDGITDNFFGLKGYDYDYWNFIINGEYSMYGIANCVVEDGDEILLFYGNGSTANVETSYNYDGKDLTIEISGVSEALVKLSGSNLDTTLEARSNNESKAFFSNISPGSYMLQVEKFSESISRGGLFLPLIVRLAPDYYLTLHDEISLDSSINFLDFSSVPSTSPKSITVSAGTTTPKIKVTTIPSTELPEILVIANNTNGARLLIPQGTTVSAVESDWDGMIALPIPATVTLTGKTVSSAIAVGTSDRELTFSQPVRLFLPGAGDKKVGFIDHNGTFSEITHSLSFDTVTQVSQELSATNRSEGKYVSGNDMVVWTKHFTTFVTYTDATSDNSGSTAKTATLRVYGYNGTSSTTMLGSTTLAIGNSDTPITLLAKSGLSYVNRGGYIASIEGLEERDYGSDSGWKYSVNGTFPSAGASSYILKNGDAVVWRYVTALNEGETTGGAVVTTGNSIQLLPVTQDEIKSALLRFIDIDPSKWYGTAIGTLVARGILAGRTETIFAPMETITRAEFAMILAKAAGVDLTVTRTNGFGDVNIGDWYAPAVAWAKEAGIVSGYKNSDGTYSYRPSDVISRQDMAVMIQNFLLHKNGEGFAITKEAIAFKDELEIASYAKTAVASMQKAGIISGVQRGQDTFFLPRNTATRAEAAVMIWQALQNK